MITKEELLQQIQYCKEKIYEMPIYLLQPQTCCYNMDKYKGTIQNFKYCPFCGKQIKGAKYE